MWRVERHHGGEESVGEVCGEHCCRSCCCPPSAAGPALIGTLAAVLAVVVIVGVQFSVSFKIQIDLEEHPMKSIPASIGMLYKAPCRIYGQLSTSFLLILVHLL